MRKTKRWIWLIAAIGLILFLTVCGITGFRASYKRPYREIVQKCGLDENLVYSVMKAESGFDEKATSRAGARGLMQLMPATAKFICEREGLEFDLTRLTEGKYNVRLGCLYLAYLLERFPVEETALCAFNAGEGTVAGWLADSAYSADGVSLDEIPYAETRAYVKKVAKFRKIYDFFY